MNTRFTTFAFVVSACFVFIGHANMYNDWAKGNAVNLFSSANGTECDESSCVQSGILSTSYGNAGTAAFAAAEIFRGKECGIGIESSYIIYEKDGYYYLGTKAWYSNATMARGSTPIGHDSELISQGYNPVAVVHDHPNSKTPWFSTGDAKGAKADGLDCYVYTCNGVKHSVLALDHNDGKVYEINPYTGMRIGIGKTSPPVNLVRNSGSVGDKDPYQGVLSYQAFPGRNDKVVAVDGLSEIEIDSQCKKNDQSEEKVCHTDSVSANQHKATNVVDAKNEAEVRVKKQDGNIESGQVFSRSETSSSTDVKKALEEFHKKFLAMPNSQFKWQQIQAYLDLVVSLESWTLPPEKVLNKLVQEGSIIRTRNNTWKDLVESPLARDDSKSCWVKEKVGICGWCRCQPPHKTPKYKYAWLGAHVEAWAFDGQREQNDVVGLLSFPVCKQCGKCYTYRRMGDDSEEVKFHVGPYEEDVDEHISQTHKIVAARKKMEDAILSIPDGEIVVPIKRICQCKHSRDKKPNIFAFYERQESEKIPRRYICADCSGLYSPNNASNSTAK